jgi:hypothetical protein
MSDAREKSTKQCETAELAHWTVNHVLDVTDGEQYVEVKNHFCPNSQETGNWTLMKAWRSDQYLKVSEDWMKYKRFRKREKNTFWMKMERFKECFDELVVCKYRDDYHIVTKQFESKNDNPIGCEVCVSEPTIVNFSVVQQDKLIAPKNYEYTVLRSFVSQHFDDYDVGIGKQHSLIRASHHEGSRIIAVEMKLEPGLFKFVVDVESPEPELSRAHVSAANSRT